MSCELYNIEERKALLYVIAFLDYDLTFSILFVVEIVMICIH